MIPETPAAFTDALQYIEDADIEDEELEKAIKEVDDEIDVFPPDRDYLDHLPTVSSRTFCTKLIELEHSAIESNEPRPNASELAQIKTDPPPTTNNSVMDDEESALWYKCLDQVKIKIEYRQRQLANIESTESNGRIKKNF